MNSKSRDKTSGDLKEHTVDHVFRYPSTFLPEENSNGYHIPFKTQQNNENVYSLKWHLDIFKN